MTQHRNFVDTLEKRVLCAVNQSSDINFGTSLQTIEGIGAGVIGYGRRDEYYTNGTKFWDDVTGDLGISASRAPLRMTYEQQNDNADPNVFDWSKFDAASLRPTMELFKKLQERGVREFLLTIWTPPYWMKTNYAHDFGGGLRLDMYDELAEFAAAGVIAARRDFGIDVTMLGIQNEQNFQEYYVSAYYDPAQLRELARAVQRKFARENITWCKILYNEDLGNDPPRWQWYNRSLQTDPEVSDFNGRFGAHQTGIQDMSKMRDSLRSNSQSLWFTEISGKPSVWRSAVNQTVDLVESFNTAGAEGFLYFQLSYPRTNPSDPATATASLMTDGVPNPKYYAVKHFSKYVRPGAKVVPVTNSQGDLFKLSAFRHPTTGAHTIVVLNKDETNSTNVTLNLSGTNVPSSWRVFQSTNATKWQTMSNLSGNRTLRLTLPPQSVVTLYSGPELTVPRGTAATYYATPFPQDAIEGSTLRRNAMLAFPSIIPQALRTESVNSASREGFTALMAASASPFVTGEQTFDLILGARPNVNAVTTDGFTALHILAMNSQVRWTTTGMDQQTTNKATKLLNAGASVNARDRFGRTALMYAAAFPKFRITTPDSSLIRTLLARGADKNLRDNLGKSAYDYAVEWGRDEAAQILAGPDNVKPVVRFGGFKSQRKSVELTVTENVTTSLDASDISIVNAQTGVAVPPSSITFSESYNFGVTAAYLRLAPGVANGSYRLSIAGRAFTDLKGNANDAYTLNFNIGGGTPQPVAGDANGDGRVNFSDLLIVSRFYGRVGGMSRAQGDLTGDGDVDFEDVLQLARNYVAR
jgi:glucuronoarabinoxylan endo-1,4-beta-xylanase